jgi:uncharacterized protein YjiS (DUF1127 family)
MSPILPRLIRSRDRLVAADARRRDAARLAMMPDTFLRDIGLSRADVPNALRGRPRRH